MESIQSDPTKKIQDILNFFGQQLSNTHELFVIVRKDGTTGEIVIQDTDPSEGEDGDSHTFDIALCECDQLIDQLIGTAEESGFSMQVVQSQPREDVYKVS